MIAVYSIPGARHFEYSGPLKTQAECAEWIKALRQRLFDAGEVLNCNQGSEILTNAQARRRNFHTCGPRDLMVSGCSCGFRNAWWS